MTALPTEVHVDRNSRGQRDTRFPHAVVATLATHQHGRVARRQLHALGLSDDVIDRWIAAHRLLPVHRGVYAVGFRRDTARARWMAAVLGAGPEAVLSHRSAGSLWEIRRSRQVEVTVPRSRRACSYTIHRAVLPADERTVVDGIPVTTVARTLFDLAAVLTLRDQERAMNEAERLRLGDTVSLPDLVERYPGRRGIRTIRAILADGRLGFDVTDEELEARFRAFVLDAALPRPVFNEPIPAGGRTYKCDAVWRRERLIVELDGFESHGTRAAYERDRARDRALSIAGWLVVRITWRQLHQTPATVAADLWKLLGERGSRSPRHARST